MAVKMTFLPKLLYLFRALPTIIPKAFIDKLQQDVNRFVWRNKRSRFFKHVLYNSQTSGGLGLPNLWLYFLAARFSQIAQWNIPDSKVPWVKFESISIKPYWLPYILWSPTNSIQKIAPLNSLVAHSLILWNRYKGKLGLMSPIPQGSSFLGDPLFSTVFKHPEGFSWWISNSLVTLADLQVGDSFATFDLLRTQKQIPLRERYHYLQIRHFYTSHFALSPSSPLHHLNRSSVTPLEEGALFLSFIQQHFHPRGTPHIKGNGS